MTPMTNFSTPDYLEAYSEPATSPEANNDKENSMPAPRTCASVPASAPSRSFEDFIDGLYLFASEWAGELAGGRGGVRVESLYNDITFRTTVFEYRRAVRSRDDHRKRMFRSMVTGGNGCTADGWDNNPYSSKVKAYGDALRGMLVRFSESAEDKLESLEKPHE